jgi:hypothetical protein
MHKVYQSALRQSERRKIWIKLIQVWRKSNLTAKVYCDKNQLKLPDLKRWDYRLKKMQSKETSRSPVITDQGLPTFIPLQLSTQPSPPSATAPIEVYCGERYRLRCYPDFDEASLVRVLTVLRRMTTC